MAPISAAAMVRLGVFSVRALMALRAEGVVMHSGLSMASTATAKRFIYLEPVGITPSWIAHFPDATALEKRASREKTI